MYPAGFLYLYTALRWLTGGAILPAQLLFAALYLANQALVLALYIQAQVRASNGGPAGTSACTTAACGLQLPQQAALCPQPGTTSVAACVGRSPPGALQQATARITGPVAVHGDAMEQRSSATMTG